MATKIQLRHDTISNWTTYNPVLLSGEIGIETDTNYIKIGNGTSNWNSLSYFTTSPTTVEGVFTKKQVELSQSFQIDYSWYNADDLSFEVEANKNYRIQSFLKINYNYYSFSTNIAIGFDCPSASHGIISSHNLYGSLQRGNYLILGGSYNPISLSDYIQDEYFYIYLDGIIITTNSGVAQMKIYQSKLYPSDLMSTVIQGSYLLYKEE